jgi:hypothetical protein
MRRTCTSAWNAAFPAKTLTKALNFACCGLQNEENPCQLVVRAVCRLFVATIITLARILAVKWVSLFVKYFEDTLNSVERFPWQWMPPHLD